MMNPDNPENTSPSLPSAASDEATLLRLLVDAAKDLAIFAVEPDGTILTWNPGVLHITRYDEHEFIGLNCDVLFTPQDREFRAPEIERETARQDGLALNERWHLRKDGTRFWGSGFMHALYDENNNLRGFAKILRDMTQEKRHQDELESLVRERTASHLAIQRRLITTEEEERRRISRELHDQTGQHLAALGIELGRMEVGTLTIRDNAAKAMTAASDAARLASEAAELAQTTALKAALSAAAPLAAELAQSASEAARTAAIAATDARAAAAAATAAMGVVEQEAPRLTHLRVLTEALSGDLHRLAVDLRPTSLDDLGLVAALRTCAQQWAERANVPIEMESVGLEEGGDLSRRLPTDLETALYRIVQEALTNAVKYAVPGGATRISVTLQRQEKQVRATIEDDGPGFDEEEAVRRGRLGLAGLRERADLLGGTLEVEATEGKGTTIYVRLPIIALSTPSESPL